jgi:hypothetical protein
VSGRGVCRPIPKEFSWESNDWYWGSPDLFGPLSQVRQTVFEDGAIPHLNCLFSISAQETDVRDAGTGMVEAMTTRTHSAVRKNGNGRVKRLHNEAFKLVDEKAGEIAAALMKATREGHVMSAKLLIELAAADVDIEEALGKRPLNTLAMRLAKEPQIPTESSEEGAEMDVQRPALVTA